MKDRNIKLPPLVGNLSGLSPHVEASVIAHGEACARTAVRLNLQQGRGEPVDDGVYAVFLLDNWDGERDTYWLIARMGDNGKLVADVNGKPLLEHDGDALLRVIPLDSTPQPAVQPLTECGLCHNMRTLDATERADGTLVNEGTKAEPVKALSDTEDGLPYCVNCLRSRQEHDGRRCPFPYRTEWTPTYGQPAQPATQDDSDSEGQWRRLALQFDGHRMQVLGWLRAAVKDLAKGGIYDNLLGSIESFLAAPPLSGEQVLTERITSLAKPAASVEPDVVLRVVHSEYEVEDPEVVRTSRRFDNLPHGTEVKLYTAPVATQPSVPEGHRLVPVEPTQEMMDAGLYQSSRDMEWADLYSAWKDMLAVSPTPPADGQAQQEECDHSYARKNLPCPECGERKPAQQDTDKGGNHG